MKDIKLKDKIAQGINDLFYIWKREFQTTFRDQGVLIFFILVPLGYPLLYSFIYDNEVVREVPAVVVDDSHSSLSREYLRKVDATPDIQIVSYCADMEEAKQTLKNRRAYGIIYIPSDFSDNIAKGKQTQVSIYCDMSGLLYYKSMLLANTAVSLDMNRDIKIARSGNTTDRQDEITAYPIEYEEISIFNPTAGFAAFLIPAVLVLIIQPQPNWATQFINIIRCPLSCGLYLLCDDSFYCHSQSGDVYADFCIHISPPVIYFRNFLAGSSYSSVLEVCILHLPLNVWN